MTIPSGPYIPERHTPSDPVIRTSDMQAAPTKATPVDADGVSIIDSAASNAFKRVLWSQIKATLKTYFDTLYSAASWGSITGTLSSQTDLQTALNAKVTSGGALGTPSSGTVTNLTGTASININGTVGATTPTTGAFTTLTSSGSVNTSNIWGTGSAAGGIALRTSAAATSFVECVGSTLLVNNIGNYTAAINRSSANAFSTTSDGGYYWGPSTTSAHSIGAVASLTQSGGVVSVNTTTAANALGSLACANVTASGTIKAGTYTVATLPSASANTRARAFASDSSLAFNSTNLGSTVTAGGSNLVPVFSNGTNWVIG
jgi:hypothetical protein